MASLIPQQGQQNRKLSPETSVLKASKGPEKWIYKGKEIIYIETNKITPNKYQPRQVFDKAALSELMSSIKQKGVIQPVLVRQRDGDVFELIAGERRLRAVKELGLDRIPAIVKNISDIESVELSLIENLQREDLNPMEQATSYRRLIKEFGFLQEELAEKIGKDRTSITNTLRLLHLPKTIQDNISTGKITFAHAKLILSVKGEAEQLQLAKDIVSLGLTVRQTTQKILVKKSVAKPKAKDKLPEIIVLEEELQRALGTKVKINPARRGGKIIIDYFSNKDLERVLKLLSDNRGAR